MASGVPVPVRTADGRYRTLVRFRLDHAAPEGAVDKLEQLLRLAPRKTAIRFGVGAPGTRLLEITGASEGDVYVFTTRVVDEIRAMGDLVDDETATPPRRERTPVAVDANWTFEAPGEGEPEPAPERRGFLRRWLRPGGD